MGVEGVGMGVGVDRGGSEWVVDSGVAWADFVGVEMSGN